MAEDGKKDIWDLAVEERDASKQGEQRGDEDSNIMFVGSQNSGKTSLILRFLEREEPPKPTTALDYTYGRRFRGANTAKDVTHLWELGGGTFLSKLVEVPITRENISTISVVLVLDLSKLDELWNTLEIFVKQIRHRVNQVLSELKPVDANNLKQRAWKKFGEDHPDKELLDPCPIPLAIIGSKYDIFQDFDPEKKKIVCKTLRFIAHTNGTSLHFSSTKSDILIARTKQLISHLAFGTGISRTMSMDYTKPLLVPAGSDALGQIGIPTLSAGDLKTINARKPLELWKQAYIGFFPQVSSQPEVADDPCKDTKYKEPDVDAIRLQKDEELESYRKDCERKAREIARQRGSVLQS